MSCVTKRGRNLERRGQRGQRERERERKRRREKERGKK